MISPFPLLGLFLLSCLLDEVSSAITFTILSSGLAKSLVTQHSFPLKWTVILELQLSKR